MRISGSIRLITLIWVLLERYFPPAAVGFRGSISVSDGATNKSVLNIEKS